MGQFLSIYLKVHHLVSIFTMAVESVTQGYESSAPSWWVDRPASMQDTLVFLLDKWKHPLKPLKSFDRKSLHACLVSPSHCERGNQGAQTAGVAHYCCYSFRYSNMCLVWYEKKVTLCILNCCSCNMHSNANIPQTWLVPTRKGRKKEKAFHKRISSYCEIGPLTTDTQKYRRKLNRKNEMKNGGRCLENKICNTEWEMPEGSLKGQGKNWECWYPVSAKPKEGKMPVRVLLLILTKITHPLKLVWVTEESVSFGGVWLWQC